MTISGRSPFGQQGGQPGGRRPPRTKPHGRDKLPEHLPVERIELDPPESLRTCACCGRDKERIGEETSERLDWRPASLVRVVTARGKYACSCEQDGVVIAEVPDSPVDKGLAGPGLLAHIAVSKYEDHLPLNRLEGIFARLGVHLSRSTMATGSRRSPTCSGPSRMRWPRRPLGRTGST